MDISYQIPYQPKDTNITPRAFSSADIGRGVDMKYDMK